MWREASDAKTLPEPVDDVWSQTGTTYDDSVTVLDAAEQGQGLALARWSLAAASIESGQLVQAHPRAATFCESLLAMSAGSGKRAQQRRDLMLVAARQRR